MVVVSSTDHKYLGAEVPDLEVGDTVSFDDFLFVVMSKMKLANKNTVLCSPNYQLELED